MLHALLVEDDVVLRRVISRALRVRAEVDEAGCFAEALERLRTTSYDVVIVDAHLPDGCGRMLLARVREDNAGCRRALIAADVPSDRAEATYERMFVTPKDLSGLVWWVDSIRTASA